MKDQKKKWSNGSAHRSACFVAILITLIAIFSSEPNKFGKLRSKQQISAATVEQQSAFERRRWPASNETNTSSNYEPTVFSKKLTESRSNFAIFYNVYFKPRGSLWDAKRIVKEQTQQIHDAINHTDVTVYYNIIGRNYTEPICPSGLNCHMLHYYDQGFEEVTLQAMYDYCQSNPGSRVSYIHDKGSFHPSGANDVTRRLSTKAVLSQECQTTMPRLPDAPCNVCTLRFQTTPMPHIPGNHFTADCKHVNKLVPPIQYENQRRELCAFVAKTYGPGEQDICPESLENTTSSRDHGLGRYAMERWVISHPDTVICETFRNDTMKNFETGFEPFFPNLKISAKLNRRINEGQIKALALLTHEFAYTYGSLQPTKGWCEYYFPRGNRCPHPSKSFMNATRRYLKSIM